MWPTDLSSIDLFTYTAPRKQEFMRRFESIQQNAFDRLRDETARSMAAV